MIMQQIIDLVIRQKLKSVNARMLNKESEWSFGALRQFYVAQQSFQAKIRRLYNLIVNFWHKDWWKM